MIMTDRPFYCTQEQVTARMRWLLLIVWMEVHIHCIMQGWGPRRIVRSPKVHNKCVPSTKAYKENVSLTCVAGVNREGIGR